MPSRLSAAPEQDKPKVRAGLALTRWQHVLPTWPTLLVAEETPKAFGDDLDNLRGHHLVSGFVALSDALEGVS
jgi:hypothetical protein